MSWPLVVALLAFAALVIVGQYSRWGVWPRSPWRVRVRRRRAPRPNPVLLHFLVMDVLDRLGDPDVRARLEQEALDIWRL